MQTDKNMLGSQSVGKLLFKLALPAVTAQIVNVLYNMVDRMYIGNIEGVGAQALTGVGVCMPLIMIISAFAALAGMGGAPRASIMMGKKDEPAAERILGNCTTLLLIVSVALTAVFLLFGRNMLLSFGASENTIGYAWDYMWIYTLGTIFVQMALGLNTFITAQGFATMSMATVLIGAVCNIILDPIFIFGMNMGVKGAALATIISQGVSCVWVLKFLTGKKTLLRIKKQNLRLSAAVILPCVALGLSPFIMQATESLIAVCFNSSLLRYGGDIAVGSMTILITVMQFCMLPLMGLSQGAQPIVSYNFGAGSAARVKKAFLLLLVSSLVYSTTLWAISMFAPQVLVFIFTKNAELMRATEAAMRIYMAASFLFGIQIACQQTFIAIGNAKVSVFLAMLRKILLLVPLIFILPAVLSEPVSALFMAEPVADTIAVVTTASMFIYHFRRAMKRLERVSA